MANSTLFAPIVPTIQPAFEYPGEATINFSFSPYSDTNVNKVRVTIINPNASSLNGANSMIINEMKYMDYQISSNQNYIKINFTDETNFSPLTKNQYYQMQLYFIDEVGNISLPSRATLIRPIDKITSLVFTYPDIMGSTPTIIDKLDIIEGYLQYENNNTIEGIDKYQIVIKNLNTDRIAYDSGYLINADGSISFKAVLNLYLEPGDYGVYFKYKTIHGFESELLEYGDFVAISFAADEDWDSLKVLITNKRDIGAVELDLTDVQDSIRQSGKIIIQRADERYTFKNWEDIGIIDYIYDANSPFPNIIYRDFLIENLLTYKYRFIYKPTDNTQHSKMSTKYWNEEKKEFVEAFWQAEIEHIFLANKSKQCAIEYNPSVSNFKYITQESITNTLGGKYPIIRKNGDTYYKQFTISGTIYLNVTDLSDIDCYDSRIGNVCNMEKFFPSDNFSLLLSKEEVFKYLQEGQAYNHLNQEQKIKLYQQRFKEATMTFLTDGNFKLFRSPTEGNMIVFLSNINFTPNKQLSRTVYDFSATVTEVCELNIENLKKYGLIQEAEILSKYYVLEANAIEKIIVNNYINIIPLIGADVVNNNNELIIKKKTIEGV